MPRVSAAHEQQRRRQILAAAMACFARQGYRATSIDDIVRESGLSVGALYSYFPSKEDLFLAVTAERTQATLAALKALFDRPGPMVAKTREAAELFFAQLAESQAPYARVTLEFWREASSSERLRRQRAATCDAVRAFFHWLFGEARRRGELRPDVDIAAAAELLMALNDGLLTHQASGLQPIPLESLKEAYVAFVTNALAASPAQAQPDPLRRRPDADARLVRPRDPQVALDASAATTP